MEKYIVCEDNGDKSIFIFIPNFLDSENLRKIKKEISDIDDWKITTKYDGKTLQRKQKWYQTENKSFGKNWIHEYSQWKSNNYSEYLLEFQDLIQRQINNTINSIGDPNIIEPRFNSLLLNYYDNGNNFIAPHKDDINSFGDKPTIALLSIGAPRTFKLEKTLPDCLKIDKRNKHMGRDYVLTDNSMLIMAGGSQTYFRHSVARETHITEPRCSITLREFI